MPCNCCTPSLAGTNKFFSRTARRYAKRYRKKGLAKEQRYIIEGIPSESVPSSTILDIGCGVGMLHLTLLQKGAESAAGIDIARGMIDEAKKLGTELNLADKSTYTNGDFLQLQESVTAADITLLDKVVCCYEEVDKLVTDSLKKTRKIYALTFPKPNRLVKMSFSVPILVGKLLRWSFHPYWHDWNAILGTIERAGFEQIYDNSTIVWAVHVFRRK